jgi:hypothetical protein
MKLSLRLFALIGFLLFVASCSDDPVSSSGGHAAPEYHATLLSLNTTFGRVCGTGPNDVYAFGNAVLHYDGAQWKPILLPSNAGTLQAAVGFPTARLP